MRPLKLLRKYGIAILLAVLGAEAGFFYSADAARNMKLASLLEQRKVLEKNIQSARINLENEKRALTGSSLHKLGVVPANSLNKNGKSRHQRMLEKISALVKNLQIKDVTLQTEADAESADYYKYSFSLQVRSKYAEIVRLINSLENKLHLTISDFSVRQSENPSVSHTAKFIVSRILLKSGSTPAAEKKIATQTIVKAVKKMDITCSRTFAHGLKASPSPVGDSNPRELSAKGGDYWSKPHVNANRAGNLYTIKIAKDPFRNPYNMVQQAGETKNVQVEKTQKSPTLTGIMDLMGIKTAVINGKILKKGDNFQGYKLLSIGKNSVILSAGRGKKQLMLKGIVSAELKELKKLPINFKPE